MKVYLNLTELGRANLTRLSKRTGLKVGQALDLLISTELIDTLPLMSRSRGRSAYTLDKHITVILHLSTTNLLDHLRGKVSRSDYIELLLRGIQ